MPRALHKYTVTINDKAAGTVEASTAQIAINRAVQRTGAKRSAVRVKLASATPGRVSNPTISGLKSEIAQADADIAELEGDPFYNSSPGLRVYRRKWLAYHRRQRRQLEALLKQVERAAMRRTNGIIEAAAGLQALEYIGDKVKKGGKPKYNPQRAGLTKRDYQTLVKEYGEGAAKKALAYWNSQPPGFRQSVKALPFLRANELLWRAYKPNPRRPSKRLVKRCFELEQALKRGEVVLANPRGSRDGFGVFHAENPGGRHNPKRRTQARPRGQAFPGDTWEGGKALQWTNAKGKKISFITARRLYYLGQRVGYHKGGEILYIREAKQNPSVEDVSQMFQGETNGDVREMKAASSAPGNLARIGKLVFLQVEGQSRPLRIPGAMVAADTRGRLWVVGTRAPLINQKAKPGEALDFGEVTRICYDTAKAHIGGGKRYEYVHEFGEDGGKRPHLLVDHEGMPILRGGDYKIEARGIVN